MNPTQLKTIWTDTLKFPPTAEHLAVLNTKVKTALKYQEFINGLNMDRLLPVLKEAKKQKGQQTAIAKNAVVDPVLKSTWELHMDFVPTPFQVVILERHVEKELNFEAHLKTITVDSLIEIVREVALYKPKGTQPAPVAQPNLNIPEAK